MAGFQHDIAGGSGDLIISQVQSPNFVHGISGWSIDRDGTAEFQDVILPGGTGITVTFSATAPASPATGDLWYNTANGLQLSQWNGSAWIAYQYGGAAIATGAITATQIAAGIVLAGVVNGTTIQGAQFIAYGTNGQMLVYSGTPAAGNLVGSWSGAGGTDAKGNPYIKGLAVGLDTGSQVLLQLLSGNSSALGLPTNAAIEDTAAFAAIVAGTGGSGTGQYISLAMEGPAVTNQGDFIVINLNSANAGSTSSANGDFDYVDTAAITHQYAYVSAAGFIVSVGAITAVNPATGTVTTPATAETPHSLSGLLTNGWSVRSGGYLAQYQMTAEGRVQIDFELSHAGTSGSSTVTTALPSEYWPAHPQDIPCGWNSSGSPASGPTVQLNTSGVLTAFNLPSGTTLIQLAASYPTN